MTTRTPQGVATAVTGGSAEPLRGLLQDALLAGDEYAAAGVLFTALDEGLTVEQALLDVIGPVQAEVGLGWAANRLTVAQEHVATAVNDRIIAALAHRSPPPRAARGRITVACVEGEWHALPARLLAETLRLRGWRVDFLGAQAPTPHLIAHLHQSGPDLVALSSSIPTRLPTAHAAITACQAAGVPVLAGGAAFGTDGRYARLLGADGWAPDARAAAELAAGGPAVPPAVPHEPVEDLPHLADQEYTLVSRGRTRLVRETVDGLADRVPALRACTERQRERTAEDIAHIVDFLATALYVDDDELFTGFLTWTAGILDARGVPARSLAPALELLGEPLRDFPRATRLLRRGGAALATA
ncbi:MULTISPECIES: cobalamin B12-binding domain-containing protein [Streptomyces]|uniref:cobalamin B12-binding domain-containing protein n=1 Tax=Streptomyces TaxID=1883 RepID=UPI000F5559A5|nr:MULTISPECIES: cobalamin-dependent protein [unclassified Streptomyces]RPK89456.1 B12 binding domain protein [Streptomyces sp. ADI98-12]WPR52388.1 cobalamin-dependent protein [Streptomyces sp. S399]